MTSCRRVCPFHDNLMMNLLPMKQLRDSLKECRTTFLEAINEPEEAWFVGINSNSKTCGTLHQWIATPFNKGDLDLNFDECQASRPELCM